MWNRFSQCLSNINKEIIEFVNDEFIFWGYQIFPDLKSTLNMEFLVLVDNTFYDTPSFLALLYLTRKSR